MMDTFYSIFTAAEVLLTVLWMMQLQKKMFENGVFNVHQRYADFE